MKKITVTRATKIEIPERAKGERRASYNRRIEAMRWFNQDCDKYLEKTIEIERINQAIGVYGFAGASGPKAMPSTFQSRVSESGELYFTTGYSNEAQLNIL